MTIARLRWHLTGSGLPRLPRLGVGLGQYFAFHGVWAPGVRALRQLSMRAKLLVLMAILAAPVLPLAWHVVEDENELVDGNAMRLAGLQLATAASAMQAELLAPTAAAAAKQPLPPDLRAKTHERLRLSYGAALAAGLPVQLAWERARASMDRALLAPYNTAPETMDLVTQAVLGLRDVRELAVASSGVLVSDDKPLQTSAVLALQELMAVQSALSEIRATLRAWSAAPPELLTLMLRTAAVNNDIRRAGERAQKLLPPAGQGGEASLPAVVAFVDLVQEQLLRPEPSPQLPRLLEAHTAARQEVMNLRLAHERRAEALLQASTEQAQHNRRLAFGALFLSTCLGVYLVYCFYLVMSGGLRELKSQMASLAAGDLSARHCPRGEDEVAQAMAATTTALVNLSDLLASVRGNVAAVKNASEQVASGNKDLTARSEASASSLGLVLEGVSRSVAQLNECGRQVEKVVGLVQSLRLASARNRKQMHRLREHMQSLRGKSHEISGMVAMIDNIAFRTNILALNASVEASKAGDAGRGFAVVATEVRALAVRGADAARRIGAVVTHCADDIEISSALADETGLVLGQADAQVDQIHTAMDDVAALTRSGQTEAVHIQDALIQIQSDTGQNMHLSKQLSAASDALRSQGEGLANKVSRFKLA